MSRYRADVDGLRTIAVVSVILFHFSVPGFSGGFVGVDIFFVISGYLIGRVILDRASEGRFSFLAFLERRVRRLYPALFVMLFASLVFFSFILIPADLRAFGKSLFAATVYSANILFYSESGYFDNAGVHKPLLHTWSLSVEEQFYILFPLCVMFLVRAGLSRRNLEAALYLGTGASLLLALWQVREAQEAAFFLFPARAWEMGLGVIASSQLWSSWASEGRRGTACAIFGTVVILVPIFTYHEGTIFPGLAALPPCLGTALLLASGSSAQTRLHTLLSTRPMVSIGLISYSLYLWHWPLVVALRYLFVDSFGLEHVLIGLILTFAFAFLSWRFVERPFRLQNTVTRRQVFGSAIVASMVASVVGLFYWHFDGVPQRYESNDRAIAYAAGDFIQSGGTCDVGLPDFTPGLHVCRIGDRTKTPDFLVWGDSHARAWRDGLHLRANELGRAGWLIWQGGCPPLFSVSKRESVSSQKADRECSEAIERLRAYLASDERLRDVLLIGRWAYYTSGGGVGIDSANRIDLLRFPADSGSNQEVFRSALLGTVYELNRARRKVTILQSVPEFESFNARLLAQRVLASRDSLAILAEKMGTMPKAAVMKRQTAASAAINPLITSGQAEYLKVEDLFCDEQVCYAVKQNVPVFFDNNHLTVKASIANREIFDSFFRSEEHLE